MAKVSHSMAECYARYHAHYRFSFEIEASDISSVYIAGFLDQLVVRTSRLSSVLLDDNHESESKMLKARVNRLENVVQVLKSFFIKKSEMVDTLETLVTKTFLEKRLHKIDGQKHEMSAFLTRSSVMRDRERVKQHEQVNHLKEEFEEFENHFNEHDYNARLVSDIVADFSVTVDKY